MKIKKIKLTKEGKIYFLFELPNSKGSMDEYSITSSEEPLSEFNETFQSLNEFVIEICELPKGDIDNIDIRGVSLSYNTATDGKEVMGVVITAQKKLLYSSCPLNLNTPHKITRFYAEHGDEKQLMPEGCEKALRRLFDAAEKFVKGNRMQMDVFSNIMGYEVEDGEEKEMLKEEFVEM